MAGADDFIREMPKQYETILSDDGINLSGGQKQRLDIARAITTKAPILILDEPTSNLDVKSRVRFEKSLDDIRSKTNITIIIISHDLRSIINADKIIVLNNGEVESFGTHKDLLLHGGWYAQAWEREIS